MRISLKEFYRFVDRKSPITEMVSEAQKIFPNLSEIDEWVNLAYQEKALEWADRSLSKIGLSSDNREQVANMFGAVAINFEYDDTRLTESYLVCDVTGFTEGVETYKLDSDSFVYEMELHVSVLKSFTVSDFISQARKTSKIKPDIKHIRDWAISEGLIEEGSRGRIPKEVVSKYNEVRLIK